MLSQSKNGAVMESLVDGKRLPVFVSDKISSLNEIVMFTTGKDVPLRTVFQNIFRKEDGKEASVSPKAENKALQTWFSKVLPEWDKERVYASDIKKVIAWYNLLLSKNLIDLEEEKEEEKTDEKN